MKELPRLDFAAEYLNFDPPSYRDAMSMSDTCPAGDRLKSRIAHLIHIPYRTIGYRSYTSKRTVDIAVHFSPERTDYPGFIQVLDDHDFGARHARHVFTVFTPGIRIALEMSWIARFKLNSNSVTCHGSHLWHEIMNFLKIKPLRNIMLGNSFPTIINGGGVPAFKSQQIGMGQ
ncbi:hypothetical protein D3C76_1250440 [compost metagenome]